MDQSMVAGSAAGAAAGRMERLIEGFARAVEPIRSTAIATDTSGLVAGEIALPTRDGSVPAYRAYPEKGTALPVVLVVQEIFGVHEHIKDVCRRLAKLGYFAITVELYARQGDVSKMSEPPEIFSTAACATPRGWR